VILGAVGLQGVIYDSYGNRIYEYSWGLSKNTNNQEEVLVVYMGLCLIPVDKMVRVIILGDSNLIIKGLRRLSKNALPSLIRIYPCIRDIENQFKSMSYFHILRRKNGKVDTLAKAHKQLAQEKFVLTRSILKLISL
jgi:ribonuclease HI